MNEAVAIKKKLRLQSTKIDACDLFAVIAGLALTLYFLLTAKLSVGLPDETTYLSIPMRILQGDRFFIDEWNLPQLSSLCSFLPFKIFVALTGSTDGCVLFMRFVFITVNAAYYCFMYRRLRQYGLWAVFASILFCGIVPQTNFCLTYFTVAPMAIMSACLILFFGEPVSKRRHLFLTGIIVAVGVLTEPFLLVLYVVYGAAFLLRKLPAKKRKENSVYAYLLSNRTFFWMTLGAFAMFIGLVGYFLYKGIFSELPKVFPYLFTGAEYNRANLTDLSKLSEVSFLFGWINLAGILVCIIASLICRFYFKNPYRLRLILYICSVLLLVSCYLCCAHKMLHGYYATGSVYHEFPMLFFPLIWYLLGKEKKDRLFIVWSIGFAASVLIDYSSDIMLASCGRVTQTVGLIFLSDLFKELKPDPFDKKRRKTDKRQIAMQRLKCVSHTVCASAIILWTLYYVVCEGLYKPTEKYFNTVNNSFSAKLEYGPYKNLITTKDIARKYNASLRDLDRIKNAANETDALYVMKLCPYMYLYADMPFGTFSAWDEDLFERHISYWTLFPENRPTYIYISKFNGHSYQTTDDVQLKEEIDSVQSVAVCDITEGEAGYIIRVERWDL